MKTRSLLGFSFAQCIVFAASIATARADSDKSVTAAQVNGTWKTKGGEFKIWALGQQRHQVEFSGVYEYKTPRGPMANEAKAAASRRSKATLPSSNPKARKRNARSR
jgi:hypothetical protein